jgi:type VI secretion system protein VasD
MFINIGLVPVRILTWLALTMTLVSCTSLNGTIGSYFGMDTDLRVEFIVDADINPDESGKASPLFIRMYELKSPKAMKQADFIDIYERDKELLGEDMVAVHNLKRFKPGESRTEHYVLDKKANYVAYFAEFLNYKDSEYKVIVSVVANNVFQSAATVHVSKNEIVVMSANAQDRFNSSQGDDIKAGMKDAQEVAGKAQGLVEDTKSMY